MLPHPGTPANVIAFHPYNPKIVVAGNNHIQMWDIEKGKCYKYGLLIFLPHYLLEIPNSQIPLFI